MAIAYLGYRVDSKQVATAEKRLDGMSGAAGVADRQSRTLASTARNLAVQLGGVVAVMSAIRGTINASQAYANMTNTLLGMGQSAEQAAMTLQQVADVSNRTRAPLEATAKLYQRVSIAGRDLGASSQDVLRFTENIGLALGAAGVGANEASGALLQLSQAMAGGVVRAEEFNSILEGAFPIAQAAANGIDAAGGSVGRLRQLVIEGKVSSEEFFNSILSQTGQLEEAFSKTTPTISQAFGVLRSNLIMAVGEFDKTTGASAAFASMILFMGNNLDEMRGFVIAAAVGITSFYSPAIVAATIKTGAWIAKLVTLRGALIATGLGAFIVGAGMLINKFLELSERVGGVGNAFALMKDVAVESFGRIPMVFSGVLSKARGFGLGIAAASADMAANALEAIISIPQKAVEVFDWAVGAIATLFSNLPSLIGGAIVSAINFVIGKVEALVQKSIDLFNGLIDGLNAIPGVDISTIGDASIGRVINEIGEGIAKIADFDASQGVAGLRATADGLRDSADGAALAGDALLALGTSPLNSIEAMRHAAADAAEAITSDDPKSLAKALKDASDAANKAMSGSGGVTESVENATNAVSDMGDAVRDDLSRAWGDFVDRGFKDFDQFGRDVLRSFMRMVGQMILFGRSNPIQIGMGVAGGVGGAMSGLGNATGGLAGLANTALAGVGGLSGLGSAFMGGANFALTNGISGIGTALAGATGGLGGLAAAAGALAVPLAGVGLLIGAFTTKTKELDRGLRVAVSGLDATAETFRKIEKSRFFGLSKSRSTSFANDPDNPVLGAVASIQDGVLQAARVMGVGSKAFEDFAFNFKVSLKGLTEEQKLQKINTELAKMGDEFASIVPNFSNMNDLLEAANRAVAETAAMGSTRFESQVLAAARRRGEITMDRSGPGFAEGQSLIRLQKLEEIDTKVEENTRQNNRLTQKMVDLLERWEEVGIPRGPVLT